MVQKTFFFLEKKLGVNHHIMRKKNSQVIKEKRLKKGPKSSHCDKGKNEILKLSYLNHRFLTCRQNTGGILIS